MDQKRFDDLTRTLNRLPFRREVLRGLAGVGLGLGVLRLSDPIEAKKKKRKGKKRKGKRKDQNQTPPVNTPPPPPLPPPFAGNCSVQRNRCTVADPILAACNLPDEFASCLVTT